MMKTTKHCVLPMLLKFIVLERTILLLRGMLLSRKSLRSIIDCFWRTINSIAYDKQRWMDMFDTSNSNHDHKVIPHSSCHLINEYASSNNTHIYTVLSLVVAWKATSAILSGFFNHCILLHIILDRKVLHDQYDKWRVCMTRRSTYQVLVEWCASMFRDYEIISRPNL